MTVMKTIYLNPLEKVINFSRTQCGKETTYRPFFYITVSQIIVRYISNSKVVTSGAWTAYPSGAPEFTPGFRGVRVARSLIVYVCFVDRCLSFCTFSFGHCVVCSSSIYGFWLPLWYLQTLFTISAWKHVNR